jgi:hypothetical protein
MRTMMMVLLLSAVLAGTTTATPPTDAEHAAMADHASCPMHAEHAVTSEHASGSTHAEPAAMTDHADCPMMAGHAASVDHNHDSFGFSHETTTHHFRLLADGGAIELQANDGADGASAAAIRVHLRELAGDFSKNDFDKPTFVHGKAPDGLETMKARHASISYTYEELPRGGRVRITTADAAALSAIHQFLRFQIDEHRTGDPAEVK